MNRPVENQTQRNQGRQRKDFVDSPLFNFFLKHFCRFAAKWQRPSDIVRIGIFFDKNDKVPAYGYPTLLELCFITFNPRLFRPHTRPLYLSCLKNSPFFTVDLIRYVRKEFEKCTPEKRAILLQIDNGKLSDTEKTARSEIRGLINQHLQLHEKAYSKLLIVTREKLVKKKT